MSQNLSSAAVVIGALRFNSALIQLNIRNIFTNLVWFDSCYSKKFWLFVFSRRGVAKVAGVKVITLYLNS